VTQCEPHPDDVSRFAVVTDAYGMMYAACRDRWELVKALVMGQNGEAIKAVRSSPTLPWAALGGLLQQRDAVYAALADMARCERAYWGAAQAIHRALPGVCVSSDMQVVDPGDDDGDAPSARWLSAYVEHLVDQVGIL
jgi:hypothetical protein